MKNKLLTIITAGIVLASGQFALANDYYYNSDYYNNDCCCSNWYVAGSGSVAWHNSMNFGTNPDNVGLDYKVGGGAAASVGYIFNMCNQWGFRLEGEFVWRRNGLKNITFVNEDDVRVTETGSGHIQNIGLMANLIADFPLFCDLSGYLGGGIGIAFTRLTGQSATFPDRTRASENLFAWQILAGFSYCLCPNIALTAGYRLFATSKFEPNREDRSIRSDRIPLTHSIDIGLRFRL